ncbi:MAG TPA: ROK family protein [Gaiellaceae bacterium]|nr:ROK family protein [Gaiellaceae bacterium]
MADPAVLAIDIGGNRVKLLTSSSDERRSFVSGPDFTPQQLVEGIKANREGWSWDVISVGIPTPVKNGKLIREPINLGPGWVDFDFESEFGVPTKVINDAAMQALGSYEGGSMLFLGLGTGLGSTLIVDGTIAPFEIGHLPFRTKTYEDYVGTRGLEQEGYAKWKAAVFEVVELFTAALEPDYVVLGGGAVKELDELPPNARPGSNANAFTGGFRLWGH